MKYLETLLASALCVCLIGCAHLPKGEIRDQLESTRIPEVWFHQAHIDDVVTFLNEQERKGVEFATPSIVLLLPFGHEAPLTSLTMRDASISEVLWAVAKLTNSKLYLRDNQVYLEPRDIKPIPPDILKHMIDPHGEGTLSNKAIDGTAE